MSPDIVSRRGWILRVGGAAVLNGLTATEFGSAETVQLPPGLYQPSLQHLAHSLKASNPPAEAGAARHFSADESSMVRTLVAIILGEPAPSAIVLDVANWLDLIVARSEAVRNAAQSLSPAHRRLAVDYYGENVVRELETEDPQKLCRDGLAALQSAGFERFDGAGRLQHLAKLEDRNDPFLVWLKRRTLDGFYSSRQGLEELDYKGNAFYADPPGCLHDAGHQ
ncbi:MAG: hypothetical protein U0Q18_22300 [Bryobacteraceae bacterium]